MPARPLLQPPPTLNQTVLPAATTASKPVSAQAPAPVPTVAPMDKSQKPIVPMATATTASAPMPTMNLNPQTMTVAGQLQGLLAQDNPYIDQARARARTESAARGLSNSSIAIQAGEQAAISQALPIAQQDANLYAQKAKSEFDLAGQYGLTDKQLQADLTKQEKAFQDTLARDKSQFGYTAQLNRQQAQLDRQNREALFRLEAANQEKLARLNASLDQSTRMNLLNRTHTLDMQKLGRQIQADEKRLAAQLTSQERLAYAESVSRRLSDLSAEIQTIQQSALRPAEKTAAVEEAKARMDSLYDYTQVVFEYVSGNGPKPADPDSNTGSGSGRGTNLPGAPVELLPKSPFPTMTDQQYAQWRKDMERVNREVAAGFGRR